MHQIEAIWQTQRADTQPVGKPQPVPIERSETLRSMSSTKVDLDSLEFGNRLNASELEGQPVQFSVSGVLRVLRRALGSDGYR